MAADHRIGPSMPPDPDDQPQLCTLAHRGFTLMGTPMFRRAETDNTAVMVVTLGEREVALPLRSLQREFAIADKSPDGKMLRMIVEALDFVAMLRPGDRLPQEVCGGGASWEPDAVHLAVASSQLHMQLVAWLNKGAAADAPQMNAEALLRLADEPEMRRRVQEALAEAAKVLGLESKEQIVHMIEELAHELAFIEALRDRLLRRMQAMAQKTATIGKSWHGDAPQTETLTQVRRLTGLALKDTARRFEELDAQTGEVMGALRNADSQRSFIRTNRDWLYRSQRAWQPILDEWNEIGTEGDEEIRTLLAQTYRFLAPRYMPVTEWILPGRPERPKVAVRQMMW
jgi:hypothetical protein